MTCWFSKQNFEQCCGGCGGPAGGDFLGGGGALQGGMEMAVDPTDPLLQMPCCWWVIFHDFCKMSVTVW